MMRRIAAVAAAVTLALTLSAQPAQAAWNACPQHHFCTWSNTNYWGVFEGLSLNDGALCLATRWDVSSVRNYRSDITIMYTNSTCSGTGLSVQSNQSFPSMPGQIGDNNLRSIKFLAW